MYHAAAVDDAATSHPIHSLLLESGVQNDWLDYEYIWVLKKIKYAKQMIHRIKQFFTASSQKQ